MQRACALILCLGTQFIARANAETPLNYVAGSSGTKAAAILPLTWGVLLISIVVIVLIGGLLAGAIWHRPGLAVAPEQRLELRGEAGGMRWLWIGVGVSTLALLGTVVWTVAVLAKINAPPSRPSLTIEVTARQWWWQVRYLDADATRVFTTANEIHIPTGTPVLFKLVGGDVIHSFWVPQLTGKTDVIPGQTNEVWLEADRPGVYRGQCTEYCGLEHAKMAFLVVAQAPADFAAWRAHQLSDAALPQEGGAVASGAAYFTMKCGACHTVRGTDAAGSFGPDLSHLRTRRTIAAGILPNTHEMLARWIADPQGLKLGSLMPRPELSDAHRAQIVSYLETLQ
jgi:cytochrome c oxidase subunit II